MVKFEIDFFNETVGADHLADLIWLYSSTIALLDNNAIEAFESKFDGILGYTDVLHISKPIGNVDNGFLPCEDILVRVKIVNENEFLVSRDGQHAAVLMADALSYKESVEVIKTSDDRLGLIKDFFK